MHAVEPECRVAGAPGHRLAELAKPLPEQHWDTVVAHSDQVRVNGAGVTSTHAVVSVRKDTIERVQVLPLVGLGTPEQGAAVEPAFAEELYTAGVAGSDYEAPVIRMGYTSYFTPSRVYDFVLPTPELPAGELLLPRRARYSAATRRRTTSPPVNGRWPPTGAGFRSRSSATPPSGRIRRRPAWCTATAPTK